ncbi:hypothetical protein [Nocardioides terrisoli]|uniref:hypothetical protein n=1 Tax=Nocardioides terrisoli TaxID=3388267 RepID=UPI00287B6255|nr:hypothetical protein [Nocardioides marmorisolisilvae]
MTSSGNARRAYCTILARNYLPKAMTLADSLRRHHDTDLVVLLIDVASDDQLPKLPGVRLVSTAGLGLSDREVLRLAMSYALVEFATAVKPLLLKRLLEDHDEAYYLDPDLYVTAPMVELSPALQASEGGIILTPHFLRPPAADAPLTEGHVLSVGIFNLGFCGVDRRASAFLDWWWGKLRNECLFDPLSGLFVDQKWVDVGASLFRAATLRHAGYNTSVANLQERPLAEDADGFVVSSTGDRLRLFHFHAFDTDAVGELSTRYDWSTAHMRDSSTAVEHLCREYGSALREWEERLPRPDYCYTHDARGRRIRRILRRVYRVQSQHADLPSPFVPAESAAYDQWRRRAWRAAARSLLGDAVKTARSSLPDETRQLQDRFPRLMGRMRDSTVERIGGWG